MLKIYANQRIPLKIFKQISRRENNETVFFFFATAHLYLCVRWEIFVKNTSLALLYRNGPLENPRKCTN